MASKTITISEEAYRRLKSRKNKNQSFTDVIKNLTRERLLSKIAGILSQEKAESLKERIKENRRKTRERIDDVKERLKDDR
ncbi:MAG: antitoxin VapB family protein [Thermoplasmatota archaeon]